jgi:DNA polymerase-3 subunit delta'
MLVKEIQLPLIASSSKNRLEKITAGIIPHAILISGGLSGNSNEVATWLAESLAVANKLSLGDIYTIHKDEASIENVHKLQAILKLKNANAAPSQTQRIILIESLDAMQLEAQNALLKSLEEPVPGNVYILSTNQLDSVLSTVKSRCVVVNLAKPSRQEFVDYFNDISLGAATSAFIASSGNINRFIRFVANENGLVEITRQILQEDTYNRLKHVTVLQENIENLDLVLGYIESAIKYRLEDSVAKDRNQSQKLMTLLESCLLTKKALASNGNPKIQIDRLFLSL